MKFNPVPDLSAKRRARMTPPGLQTQRPRVAPGPDSEGLVSRQRRFSFAKACFRRSTRDCRRCPRRWPDR
ncbi:hypothetical protein [Lysobacter gummosus]|uniref:hypothetical protein n=1 Tax=Lysobacter gummosus TaxID=262324 RepID=UPI00362CFD81